MKIQITKKHAIIFLVSLVLLFSAIAIALTPSQLGHTANEISGLKEFFKTNGPLTAKTIQCNSGQCINEIKENADAVCINAPLKQINYQWFGISSTTTPINMHSFCQSKGYDFAGIDSNGRMCNNGYGLRIEYRSKSEGEPLQYWCYDPSAYPNPRALSSVYCIDY